MDMPIAKTPFRPATFLSRDVEARGGEDGVVYLKSRHALKEYAPHIPALLARWAAEAPERTWLAQRRGPERAWLKVSYAEAKRTVDSLTQAFLDLGLGPDRPVMVLSGNSIEMAMVTLAAMQARAPLAPVSVAYSLVSQDHAKLKYVFDLVRPGLVMVQNGPAFAGALAALDLTGVAVLQVEAPVPGRDSLAYADLARTTPTPAVERSIAAIGPDTVGKYLFTSGSTGMPKAVINTQRMMCANLAMMQMGRTRDPDEEPPTVLDWLPWNHTMGGNATFHTLLGDGGTAYLDEGRPLPGQFEPTLRNLREIAPTNFSNVPAGYAMLAPALEADDALAAKFFSKLRGLGYGGATLPDDLYERMEALAVKHTGYRIPFTTGWGCTETAPTATAVHWASERVGLIGLPYPGVELKMVPTGAPGRYEMRIKGPLVMPGYHKRPDLTAQAFDEEGFYRIGDAGRFVDDNDPAQGLVFDGRVVEDFKLMSGTFVHVGSLRTASVAAASPALQDAVVTGQDKPFAGLLAFPNLAGCRALAGDAEAKLSAAELLRHPKVVERIRAGLAQMNKAAGGESRRIGRVLLAVDPPSIDGGEITDKGYINQRAALERRATAVAALYADPPGDDVIVIG